MIGSWDIRNEGIIKFECGGVKQYAITFQSGSVDIKFKGIPSDAELIYANVITGDIEYNQYVSDMNGKIKEKTVKTKIASIPKRKFITNQYSVPYTEEDLKEISFGKINFIGGMKDVA